MEDYHIEEESYKLYIRFNTNHKCRKFTSYINNLTRNIDIESHVSDNKSICLKNICIKNLEILINDFNVDCSIVNECDICCIEKRLYMVCNTCMHPICLDCLNSISDNKCAFCRSFI